MLLVPGLLGESSFEKIALIVAKERFFEDFDCLHCSFLALLELTSPENDVF